MKRSLILMSGILLLSSTLVFAQAPVVTEGPVSQEKDKSHKWGQHKDKDKKCMMCGMMMKSKMKTELLATSDGGVVLLKGNTLTKFDKNLNMVKEVELKQEDMHKMMMEMKEKCSMCKMMKEGKADHEAHDAAEDASSEE